MIKFVLAASVLGLSTSVAWPQSQLGAPHSDDNRPNIRAETHCKDKTGHVWLKSSAELAGTTSSGSEKTAAAPNAETQRPAAMPESTGLGSVAATLPECPAQRSETPRNVPATPSLSETTGSDGGRKSDSSGGDPSTLTPGGLTPD